MSSHARSREEERRLSVRTLIIASFASAMAAIITSQFWTAGTPIAAAATPVIVTLVSELLHRPTQRIAERLTTETDGLPPQTDALPEAAGAAPPPRGEEHHARPAPEYRVYRTSPQTSRDLPWKAILLTAALAFTLAAAALSLPELIAGQSVGKGDRNFTLFGGGSRSKDTPQPPQTEQEGTEAEQTQPGSEATAPDETVPNLQTQPPSTSPAKPQSTTPAQTTPAPRSGTPAPVQP